MKPRVLVDFVLGELRRQTEHAQIQQALITRGVPSEQVELVIAAVSEGFKAGTLAVVTGGQSVKGLPLGQNPFFDIAFKRGRAAMRFRTPFWVLARFAWPVILGVVVVVLLITLLK